MIRFGPSIPKLHRRLEAFVLPQGSKEKGVGAVVVPLLWSRETTKSNQRFPLEAARNKATATTTSTTQASAPPTT
jgi:hypothetical protein